ncbi:LexA family transcriptional regulator [Shewanella sp. SM34]|uniref:LexA family transcriptional regulator n=1 Tax=unclassified Shewanella TaxID=196818 RepID=UPI0021D8BB24|nr:MULTISPECIES: LexA family transcriptional regulator [unclassified Shewanella]MCU8058040.1 LexA family transcriptional regulator [Shewanella sp. SM35]MCU8066870.1 LexA family transcriptional regulator [Shewanella sp. SM34]
MSSGIGKRIKELRVSKGYTQKSLAKKLSVTPMAISQWETAKTEPKGSHLRAFCTLFNVSLEWLSTGMTKASVNFDSKLGSVSVPFAEIQNLTRSATNSHFVIDASFLDGVDINNALCVEVIGNSMEPLLPDSSLVIIDTNDTFIKDGKFYVLKQGDRVWVKILSYTSSGIRVKSFNSDYKDEIYTFQEFSKFEVIGKVKCQITTR